MPTNIEQGKAYFARLNGGVIWNFFWLHCTNPTLFPIFDQHTYRAQKFIAENRLTEISYLNDKLVNHFFYY